MSTADFDRAVRNARRAGKTLSQQRYRRAMSVRRLALLPWAKLTPAVTITFIPSGVC